MQEIVLQFISAVSCEMIVQWLVESVLSTLDCHCLKKGPRRGCRSHRVKKLSCQGANDYLRRSEFILIEASPFWFVKTVFSHATVSAWHRLRAMNRLRRLQGRNLSPPFEAIEHVLF